MVGSILFYSIAAMSGHEVSSFNAAFLINQLQNSDKYKSNIEFELWNNSVNVTYGSPHKHALNMMGETLLKRNRKSTNHQAEHFFVQAAIQKYPRALFNLAQFSELNNSTLKLLRLSPTRHKEELLEICVKNGEFADILPCYIFKLKNEIRGYGKLALSTIVLYLSIVLLYFLVYYIFLHY